MVLLRDTYGADAISFVDDIFDVNKPWVYSLLDEMKSRKLKLYWGCSSRVNHADLEFYKKIYERGIRKGNFKVLEFQNKRELKPWIKPVLQLMNECYTESSIYGYAPLDEKEMNNLTKRYLPIINPRFVKVVTKDHEVVAFVVGIPDMTEGIQKAKGRLFPLGFLKILRAAKETNQLDLLLGAIKEKYRGVGLDVLMGVRMLTSAKEAGLEIMDTHHEMETNTRVRAEMEKMGGKIYKRYRVFQKYL